MREDAAPGIVFGGRPEEETIRIPCPICGERDSREFLCLGSRDYLDRPQDTAWSAAWDAYLHSRTNAAGPVTDLWYHEGGCGAWLLVERNSASHEITGATLATGAAR